MLKVLISGFCSLFFTWDSLAKSIERPLSVHSKQENTQPRIQNRNSRRVYVVENGIVAAKSDSTLNMTDSSEINTINSADQKSFDEENKDKNQQDFPTVPLKHLALKKINQDLVEVHIRCIFLRVGEIDTVNERYYAEILVEASWEDISFKGSQNREFDPTIHWTPKLTLMNAIGQLQDVITYNVRYNQQGMATVTEYHKLKGTFWERMELQHFPMDIQDLSIIMSTSHTNTELIFVTNPNKSSGVNRQVFTDEQEWYLFEHVDFQITEQFDEYLDNGRHHSVIVCSCHAARKYGYFMWNAYFLIFLITSASFTTFPIPLANIQGRVQIACTLLLTSITFRWSCNRALPTISYLTAVDVYAIGSIFSLCLLNIFHGVIGYVNYYVSTNTTSSTAVTTSVPSIIVIDRWALVVFSILFFGYQIGTIIWMCLVPWKKRRMMFEKDNKNRLNNTLKGYNANSTFVDAMSKAKKTLNEPYNLPMVANTDL